MRVLLLLIALSCNALAAEYFVSLSGDNGATGLSEAAAFRTVQKGVDALKPGDTLTLLPGEYNEQVARKGLGSADAVTTLRAKIPGTAVLRGDVPVTGFKPAEGLRGVYVAPYQGPLEGVNESDSYTGLLRQPSPADLQFRKGAFHHDAKAGRLYVSSTDFRPASEHHYSVSILPGHGLHLEGPQRVVVDGICATGFRSLKEMSHHSQYAAYGIFLIDAKGCTIRGSTSWLNEGGIAVRSVKGKSENVIEDCTAYGNASGASSEGGNIIIFSPQADVIRRCVAYRSWRHGLRLYGRGGHSSAIEDSLAWGNRVDAFLKGEKEIGVLRRTVALGTGHALQVDHALVGGHNTYLPPGDTPLHSVPNARNQLEWDAEFADPVNFDFRLQGTSRLRASGPEGAHRGPHPWRDDVRFLRPDGDDAADGLSLKTAWKTLGHAVAQAKTGQTLYLAPGRYGGDVAVATERLTLAGRGEGQVRLTGQVVVKKANGAALRRIDFTQPLQIEGSNGVGVENCRFRGEEEGLSATRCEDLRLVHNEFTVFTKAGLRLTKCEGTYLESNLYDNRKAPAVVLAGGEEPVLYSDYNTYADAEASWRVGKKVRALKELPGDRYSTHWVPRYTPTEGGGLRLANELERKVAGAHGEGAGFHQEILREEVALTPPVVHSTSATTANVEWMANDAALFTLAWGKTPECLDGSDTYLQDDWVGSLVSYSLTGLEPGQTVYFRIRSVERPPVLGRRQKALPVAAEVTAPLKITTLAEDRAPRTWHVANDGSDSASGESRESALRSIQAAADRVGPGDTVLIHGGEYTECVFVRATGEKGRPIVFRSAPGERVFFASGGKQLGSAWSIRAKKEISLDGFSFGQFGPTGGGGDKRLINVYLCEGISITRCLSDQRGPGYSSAFLRVETSRNVRVANCVTYNGFDGINVQGVDDFVFEHNVLARPLTVGVQISVAPGGRAVLRNNIFTDSQPYKADAGIHYHEWGGYPRIEDTNNIYFLSKPASERQLYWLLNYTDGKAAPAHTKMSLPEYQRLFPSKGRPSVVADPLFAGMMHAKPAGLPPAKQSELLFPLGRVDFDTFFATNPEVVERGAGLQREAFREWSFPETFEKAAGKSMSLK